MLSPFSLKIVKKLTALCSQGLICGSLCLAFGAQAADLSKIQQQIKQQEQKIAEQKREQNKLQSSLKSHENQINDIVGNLRKTETSLKETKKIIADTNKQIQQLEQQQKAQKAKLADQLDAIYRNGNPNSVIEHLLSEEAQNNDRMMVYAKHMNQSRIALLDDLKATLAQLDEQKAYLSSQQQEQQSQLSEQKKQQQALQKAKNARQSTLNQLNKTLERDQNKLETLKANETALRNEINRAAQQAREQEQKEREQLAQKKQAEEKRTNRTYQPTEQEQQLIRSGSGLAGKYPRPVNGSILHNYGSTQVGEVKWKGIVISASTGTAVKAIAAGRVILANWLSGYGQVVVIDHGKGDMSLYGYNQALFVRTGTLVKAGQKIAEVGNSGGQGRSALYFEIRRQGNAVNPMNWLR
ncbi:septal ring factor EnvC (AmiA/AmiB activator) [Pasteurella langaaensis DSM 22999]|uniref:Septal ring factor EnvC (AmiA/AmiB activator) n=1 Tax=Alitibacter langaaensis DSM 22999 TaxID=1122935 RepID=A0A2U0T6I6_9PAST|nr:murein hydrolase activator EnvC [Pasteurella langaaensis]PVX39216.1 septal ring factor EnvC (AmiA/AmiB activator) [Pasteurella langaaensis DSM 22999]